MSDIYTKIYVFIITAYYPDEDKFTNNFKTRRS